MSRLVAFALSLLLLLAHPALAQLAAIPPLTSPVIDTTGTLSPGAVASLEQWLRDYRQSKGAQVQVLIVPTTQPEDIAQYGIRVAEAWGIGRKVQGTQRIDDGLIFIVAKEDRRMRFEVGYGLEGVLPDATAKRIIDEQVQPRFRAGDFDGGTKAAIDSALRLIDGEPLPPPVPETGGAAEGNWVVAAMIGFFVGGFIGGILRKPFGRPLASGVSGVAAGGVTWVLLSSLGFAAVGGVIGALIALFSQSSRRGGWTSHTGGWGGGWGGGGWSGGGGGWSSGGGGGWSGGGGGFGGGGASGSW